MKRLQPSGPSGQRGFTLVEAIIGLMMLVLAASVMFFALMQINRMASVSRVMTAANFIVQSNIDTIQSDSPFVPQNSLVPTELTLGTTSSNNIPIYTDPYTNNVVVSGDLTTTISNISNTSNSSNPEYAYQAVVKLAFTYRSKNYQLVACTVRGSDE